MNRHANQPCLMCRLAADDRGGEPGRALCIHTRYPTHSPWSRLKFGRQPNSSSGRDWWLDVSRMDAVVEVHQEDLQVSVQPGIVYNNLNEQLKPHGLFFRLRLEAVLTWRLLAVWRQIMPAVFIR